VAVALLALAVGGAAVAQDFGAAVITEDGYLPAGVLVDGEMALVTDVVDGDTIKVDRGKGEETLRYIGIDTPETVHPGEPVQPYGAEASAANAELVNGRLVILERDTSEVDRYGRLLRYVWIQTDDGVLSVNNELVRRGLADVIAYEPDTRYHDFFSRTLAQAQAEGVGMWAADAEFATPEPTAAPTPRPTRKPTPAPIDKTLTTRGKTLKYRWLDDREFDCNNRYGCWGLLVKATKGCSKRLDVKVVLRDENGNWVDAVTKSRSKVKKGQQVRFKIVATDADAARANLKNVRCLQTPKPTPKPTPRPKARSTRVGCDPSYPTVCIPNYPPDLDCGQIPYRRFAVRGPDYHGFDGDNDGVGCES
jgi:micrococcal nuclease